MHTRLRTRRRVGGEGRPSAPQRVASQRAPTPKLVGALLPGRPTAWVHFRERTTRECLSAPRRSDLPAAAQLPSTGKYQPAPQSMPVVGARSRSWLYAVPLLASCRSAAPDTL